MPDAKDIKIDQNRKILIYGPTGSGKTKLFTSIPGKKLLYLFDPGGLITIAGCDNLSYRPFFPEQVLGLKTTLKGRLETKGAKRHEPTVYIDFEKDVEAELENGFKDFDVVGFDSLSTLSLIVMDRILFLQGRWGKVPELSDYNIVGDSIVNLFRSVLAIQDKIIYVTAHDDLVQDSISKKVITRLDVIKNLRRLLPRLVSDVWISSAESTPDKGDTFTIQTMPTREHPHAKNSFNLPLYVDVTVKGSGGGYQNLLNTKGGK